MNCYFYIHGAVHNVCGDVRACVGTANAILFSIASLPYYSLSFVHFQGSSHRVVQRPACRLFSCLSSITVTLFHFISIFLLISYACQLNSQFAFFLLEFKSISPAKCYIASQAVCASCISILFHTNSYSPCNFFAFFLF